MAIGWCDKVLGARLLGGGCLGEGLSVVVD